MADIRIQVDGLTVVRRVMRNINPGVNSVFVHRALTKGGALIQENAAIKQIIPGGKQAPVKKKLTSRSGTGRRSIRVDRSELEKLFVDIGSDVIYMKNHETGGTFLVPTHNVRSYKRKNSLARKGRRRVVVRAHTRNAHNITFPARPFLAPAVDAVNNELENLFVLEWKREIDKR